MEPADMIFAAKRAQQLTGRADAVVAFIVPGKWPDRGDRKRLAGRRGPLGQCVAEYEDAVLCTFKANEVIAFARRALAAEAAAIGEEMAEAAENNPGLFQDQT